MKVAQEERGEAVSSGFSISISGLIGFKAIDLGHLGRSAVEHLPSAQGVIPGSWDRVPHRGPCREPDSPSACVSASLSASLMNK